MSIILTVELTAEQAMDYLCDINIDIPAFRHWQDLRFTLSLVNKEAKPIINVFDDKSGLAWALDLQERTYARCKNGVWSKSMTLDGFGFEELHLDLGVAE